MLDFKSKKAKSKYFVYTFQTQTINDEVNASISLEFDAIVSVPDSDARFVYRKGKKYFHTLVEYLKAVTKRTTIRIER
jgi:hypothetical protein